jgi:HEAT repeat protein
VEWAGKRDNPPRHQSPEKKLKSTSHGNLGTLSARLAAFMHIREGEGRLVVLMMATMFLPSAGAAIGVSSAESLFLSRVGADALPGLYVALGLVTIVATLGVTALLGRMPPIRLYLFMPIGVALLLGGARFLVELNFDGIYQLLWVTVFLFDTFMRLVLWGIAGISFDTRQAKRLFPLFVAAGILGFSVGGLATGPLVQQLGTENLLLVWAGTLLLGFVFTRSITRRTGASPTTSMRRIRRRSGGRVRDDLQAGFQYVRQSRLMRWIALSALLFQALYFLLAFPFSKAVEMHHPIEDEMTAFLGVFRGVTTGSALLISVLVATRFNARFGLMAGFLVLAVFDFIGFSGLSLWSTFMAIVAFRFLHETWQSGITRTAWFAQFNIVPPVRREQTRMFVNGVCLQIGVVLVGITLLVSNKLMAAEQLYIIGAVVAGFTLFAVSRARQAYLSALVDALHAGRPHVFSSEEDPFSTFQQDAAAMNVAIAGLSDTDPAVRRVAADILSNLNVPEAATNLEEALSDGNVEVRLAVLPALARLNATSAWDKVVFCLSDPASEVRAQAVATLRRLAKNGTEFPMHVQPLLDDPVAAVRAVAAVALLSTGPHERAEQTLRQMSVAEDADARVEAVNSLGSWGSTEAYAPAQAALSDAEPIVRRAAASALAHIDDPRCAETLVCALNDDDSSVRKAIAESIGVIGLPTLDRTVKSLSDPNLEEGALLALERLPVASHAATIRAYAQNRVTKSLHYHRLWRHAIVLVGRDFRAQLLADALQYNAEYNGINALRAVGVLEDSNAVAVAIDSLNSADPLQRANAVETLDSIADRDIVRPVLRLWEPGDSRRSTFARLAPEQVLHQALQDANSWLRACAALAADGVDSPEIQSELSQLAQSDPDPLVRDTAAAALNGEKTMQTLHTLSLMERILFLKRVPLFANLPPAELKQVAAIADEHLFVDGEIMAQQGEPGDELYVIVSGQVRVLVTGDGEQESELALRGAGDYVGEMAIISKKPRMARLVAAGDVRTLCIEQKQFEGILRERPETSLAVMRDLCDRLRERAKR